MKKKIFSLDNLSLARKVLIAFFLISILPLLVAGFYYTYQFLPYYAFIILGVNILLGWWIIAQILLSIGRIIRKAQLKEVRKQASSYTNDEIKVLDEAFDHISKNVKSRFEELKEVSKNTEKLNMEVSKKVSILSTIMHINDLVSQQRDIKEVFELVTTRVAEILDMDMCFILLDNGKGYLETEELLSEHQVQLKPLSKSEELIKPLLEKRQKMVYDKGHNQNKELGDFAWERCKVGSLALVPISLSKKIIGILGAGRKDKEASLSEDDTDTLEIFAKHLSFLFEYKEMRFKMKELEFKDSATGLYNKDFLTEELEKNIKTAMKRQSSCGLILIRIKNLRKYIDKYGVFAFEKVIRTMSVTLTEDLIGCQIGRIKEDELGAILPEAGKAELEKKSESVIAKMKQRLPAEEDLELCWAIAENPVDGACAKELIQKAREDIER